jgi:peptidoglycan/xylan/chitin deacetylase (PgdA/CDA1 family)
VEYLNTHYNITDLESLRDHYENGAPLPRNALFITFDDGWRSNYDLLPIIEEKKLSITIFLTTGLIGTNKKPAPLTNYNEKTVEEITDSYPSESERTMLSIDEIKDMSKLINFQAHGVHHHLSTYLTEEQLKAEIIESKNTVEGITGKPVYGFAYPYNRAGEKEAIIVKSCGFVLARRGGRIMNNPSTDRFLLNSIGIDENCSLKDFKTKIFRSELKTVLRSPN